MNYKTLNVKRRIPSPQPRRIMPDTFPIKPLPALPRGGKWRMP